MRWLRRSLVMVGVVLLGACRQVTVPDAPVDADRDIRGQVLDASGQPLAGAAVVLQFQTDPLLQDYDYAGKNVAALLPATEDSVHVVVWLSSFCDTDTVRFLYDGDLPPGEPIIWNGRDDDGRVVTDGVYWAHFVTDADAWRVSLTLLLLGSRYAPRRLDARPLAVTDAEGRFRLPQTCLPFEYRWVTTAADGSGVYTPALRVTRHVRVWVFEPQTRDPARSGWVTVLYDAGIEVTVTYEG